MEKKPRMTFIIMPVGLECNLACKYCYHGVVAKAQKAFITMSDDILKRIISEAPLLGVDVDFLWHGGEALLAGLDHFRSAVDFQRGVSFEGVVRNLLQSNLTLFNESYCNFFAKENFSLSTSIDGGREAHDANRIFINGRGTYGRVTDAVAMWRRKTGKRMGAVSGQTHTNLI